MHDTAWRPHPPSEDELPPGYSWSSYEEPLRTDFPDDEAPVLFMLPVSGGDSVSYWHSTSPRLNDTIPEPSPPPATEPPPAAEPLRLCLMVGTRSAGKTTLGAAWGRTPAGQGVGMPSITPGDSLHAWTLAADDAFRDPRRSSSPLRDGALHVQSPDSGLAHWTLREPLADIIFAAASPSPTRTEHSRLLAPPTPDSGWTSMALVLCIDGAAPQRELWQRALPRLIESWSATTAGDAQRRLPFDRVLVLLTRVDRLCAQTCVAAQRGRSVAQRTLAAMTPEGLATRLDPAQQVRAVLGDDVLARLLSALRPDARAAAGLVTTPGWTAAPPGTPQAVLPWSSSTWQPFGAHEAIRFLASGPVAFPLAPLTHMEMQRELVTLTR